MLRRIARVHARHWRDPGLQGRPWLPCHTFWFTGRLHRRSAGLRARLRPAAPGRGDAIEAALRQRPTTLVHGDLRADNLLFEGSN